MRHSESIKEIAAALAKAQGAMANAKKDSTNPHFKSQYADLASIVAAIKKPLADNGISYTQAPVTNEKDELGIETLLMHSSGEWIVADPFYIPVSKQDAQGFGSAMTYARRYSLAAIMGVAPDDDDGNAAALARPAPKEQPYGVKETNALATLREAAFNGSEALQAAWDAIGKEMRVRLAKELPSLKQAAQEPAHA